jgi:hypothetical protein
MAQAPRDKAPTALPLAVPMLARAVVLMLGLTGVFAAGYGVFGTWVVSNDWLSCVNPSFHPIGDYPSDYCESVPWLSQLGIGLGLLAGGLLAVGVAIWLLRSRFAARPTRAR